MMVNFVSIEQFIYMFAPLIYLPGLHDIFQVTADLIPLNSRKVAVKFDYFKILGLVSLSNLVN